MLTSDNSHSASHAEARKRPAQERSRRTVEAILEAAAQLLATKGYRATTTNHVAERAGVSIGSLYQYFPNKDALVAALVEEHLAAAGEMIRDACRAWRRDRPGPAEFAASFARLLVEVNDAPVHRVTYNNAPPLPRTQEMTEALVAELADEVAIHLRRWKTPGPPELRARTLVIAVLAVIHELVIQTPPGPARTAAQQQAAELARGFITPAPAGSRHAPDPTVDAARRNEHDVQ
ncbi:TetR/AcrR family transcriptional regulator [Frankia sp. R43]|uniref:TetR/AcrR family transcriptional regulator n=1 Tax=Frankia sp. R43 TaxID=269536 RepID=UPI0006C9EEE9|nr:TetR/AcrR family transcriptional regulator [Frankia sp. R43]